MKVVDLVVGYPYINPIRTGKDTLMTAIMICAGGFLVGQYVTGMIINAFWRHR